MNKKVSRTYTVWQMDTRYRKTLYGMHTSQCGFIHGKFKPSQFFPNDATQLTEDSIEKILLQLNKLWKTQGLLSAQEYLSSYYVPGHLLGMRGTAMSKLDKAPAVRKLPLLWSLGDGDEIPVDSHS